jgi:hypothetical protein
MYSIYISKCHKASRADVWGRAEVDVELHLQKKMMILNHSDISQFDIRVSKFVNGIKNL